MQTAHDRFSFIRHHLPAMLYGAIIVIVSSLPQVDAPELPFVGMDKLLHFVEYAIFAFLVYRSFSNIEKLKSGAMSALISILFLIAFAWGDEYHQKFVAGRSSDVFDTIADIIGALCVIALLSLRSRRQSKTEP